MTPAVLAADHWHAACSTQLTLTTQEVEMRETSKAKSMIMCTVAGSMVAAGCAGQRAEPVPEVRRLEANERSRELGIHVWILDGDQKAGYTISAFDADGARIGAAEVQVDPFMQHTVTVRTAEHTAYQSWSFEGRGYRYVNAIDGAELAITGNLDDQQLYLEVGGRADRLGLFDDQLEMIDKEEVVRFLEASGFPRLSLTDAGAILQRITGEPELFKTLNPPHESSHANGEHPEEEIYRRLAGDPTAIGQPVERMHLCSVCDFVTQLIIGGLIATKCVATCPFLAGKFCCAFLIGGDIALIMQCLYDYFNKVTNCNGHACPNVWQNATGTVYNGNACSQAEHVCCCDCDPDQCQAYCEAEGARCQLGQGPGEEVGGSCGEAVPTLSGTCNAPCTCFYTFIDADGVMQRCTFDAAGGGGGAGAPGPGGQLQDVACLVCAVAL